jgi:integrase
VPRLGVRTDLPIGNVDRKVAEATLARFATNLDGTPAAPNVRTRRRAGFSKILEHAAAEGIIAASPLRTIRVRKAQRATTRISQSCVGDPSLIPAALAHVRAMGNRGPTFAAFLATVFYSGARPSEVAALRLEHSAEMCPRVYFHHIMGDEPRWNGAIEDAMPV